MKKELVNEKTVVEVGKYYLVKCAIISNGVREYPIPVIGVEHNDKAFGFEKAHIHIDGRFCGEKERKMLDITSEGKTNSVLVLKKADYFHYYVVRYETRVRLCKRLTTGINPPQNEGRAILFYQWVETMTGKSCKGKKCPHLGTEMFEEDGVLVCPLHNLISDEKKEVIVGVRK